MNFIFLDMKKTLFIFSIFALLFLKNKAQNLEIVSIDKFKRDSTAMADNKSFQVGEILRYDAKFGVVKGGEAVLVTKIEEIGDSYYYHFRAVAKNAGFAGNFFFLENVYDSYVDIISGLPIKSVRNIKEENYRNYNEVLFDRTKNQIISTNKGVVPSKPNIVDIVSGFYYTRRFLFNELKKNQIILLNVYFEDKFYTLKFKYTKTEKINTNFGRVECIKLVPVIEPNGSFKKEKDLQIWITNDDAHILVKVKAAVAIGTAVIVLKDFNYVVENSFLQKNKEKGEKGEDED